MKTAVIGLGKLGFPLALKLADSRGDEVWIYDSNSQLVESIFNGTFSSSEPGVNSLYRQNLGNLRRARSMEQIVNETEVLFIVVPTPSLPSGRFSNEAIQSVIRNLAPAIAKKSQEKMLTIDIVSTVMPGSCDEVFAPLIEELTGRKIGVDLGLCYNPEFIALGSVISDMENADMHLVGSSNRAHGEKIIECLKRLTNADTPSALLSLKEAELVKIAINNYLTLKVSFANLIQVMCDSLGLPSAQRITAAIGMDRRIGHHYLRPGAPFAGPCFPRDTIAMQSLLDSEMNLAKSTTQFNSLYTEYLIKKVMGSIHPFNTIGVFGISYKEGSNVIEGSVTVPLADSIIKSGKRVIFYDRDFDSTSLPVPGLRQVSSVEDFISQCDFLVLAKTVNGNPEIMEAIASGKPSFDFWNQ